MFEADFVERYLREIGVQTPVSLVRSGSEPSRTEEPVTQALAADMSTSESQPAPTKITQVMGTIMSIQSMAVEAMQCQRCVLAESRQHVVFGQGKHDADLLFIGEAPNSAEDKLGTSFVGDVGNMFDSMLMAIGLDREQIYSLNILQCLPPNHRDPKQGELDACRIWLNAQLDSVSPKVICVMGRVAAQALLGTDAVLHDLRGEWHSYRGIPVWVSYHPAYLLRSPKAKKKVWADLLTLQKRLVGLLPSA